MVLKNKKNIMIIGTGGTIAGKAEKRTTSSYDSAQVKIDGLIDEIPELEKLANLSSFEIFSVDSCDMSFKNLMLLSKFLNDKSKDDNIDGFVITHGTDTLEETAYFLNLTVKTKKPIVITGSMRPSTALSADGPFNLYQSVALAASDEAIGRGVLIVFSDKIFGARDIHKINTFCTDAFSQKDLGCFGYMRDENAYFFNQSIKRHTYESQFDVNKIDVLPKVESVTFNLDSDINVLKYIVSVTDGIVLAGAGCGGCCESWNNLIKSKLKSGFPIVRSSRVGNGLVTHEISQIENVGIFAESLSAQKARILLTLALTQTKNLYEIQNIFQTY